MAKITAAEFQKNFGRYRDLAQREAVSVTSHGRESVVLISAAEYHRFRALDTRRAEYVWEMPEADIAVLASAEPPAEADAFNDEVPPT
jgi:prevent-host-death family protein